MPQGRLYKTGEDAPVVFEYRVFLHKTPGAEVKEMFGYGSRNKTKPNAHPTSRNPVCI